VGRPVAQGALRQVVQIDLPVCLEALAQLGAVLEACAAELVFDTAVEAFDHPVGLRVPGPDQPVLDAMLRTHAVEHVLACRRALAPVHEAVGELGPVVREHLLDLERRRGDQALQEPGGSFCPLVGVDLEEHPAGGAVDGHVQVAPVRLVRHPRQVLHVHVHEPRRVALERLGWLLGFLLRHQRAQVRDAVSLHHALERRLAHGGADELAHQHEQVSGVEQERAAQLGDDLLLLGRQRRMQRVRPVRRVLAGGTLPPLVDRLVVQAVALRQRVGRDRGGRCAELGTDRGRRPRILVESQDHGVIPVGGRVWSVARGRRSKRAVRFAASQTRPAKMRARRGSAQSPDPSHL